MLIPVLAAAHNRQIPPHPILSVRQLVQELSRAGLGPINVAPDVAENRVMVLPNGATPNRVLHRLAEALDASLVPDKDGITLQRTTEDLRRMRVRIEKERAGWIRRRMNQIRDYREKMLKTSARETAIIKALGDQWKNYWDLMQRRALANWPYRASQLTPEQVLLEGLIERIGVETFASLPPQESVVFEDRPVLDAKPLPPIADLRSAYVAAHQKLAATELPAQTQERIRMMGMESMLAAPSEHPESLRFRLEATALASEVVIELAVYDEQGKQVGFAWLDVSAKEPGVDVPLLLRQEENRPGSQWVDLSPETVQELSFGAAPSPERPIPDWVLHPETNDPLNAFVKEPFARIAAETPDKCVVFVVMDRLANTILRSRKGNKVNIPALKLAMELEAPYDRIDLGDTVIWRPKNLLAEEASRADRGILGKFARRAAKGVPCDLQRVSVLLHDAAAQPSQMATLWVWKIPKFMDQVSVVLLVREAVLRFLGGLPPTFWQREGETRIGELGARESFVKLLDVPMTLEAPKEGARDVYKHPTELFADVDPSDARIYMGPETHRVVKITHSEGFSNPNWTTPEAILPEFRLGAESATLNDGGQMTVTREEFERSLNEKVEFQYGSETDQVLRIDLPKGYGYRFVLKSSVIPQGSPWRYGDLPAKYREDYWKWASQEAIASLRRIMDPNRKIINTADDPILPAPPPK